MDQNRTWCFLLPLFLNLQQRSFLCLCKHGQLLPGNIRTIYRHSIDFILCHQHCTLIHQRPYHSCRHPKFSGRFCIIQFLLFQKRPNQSCPGFASATLQFRCQLLCHCHIHIQHYITFLFCFDLFPDRKNRFQRLYHCRTVSVLHPCRKCDQAFFCGLLTAADSMKFFHFGYIKCRFVRKAYHISLSFMITVSKGNGHYHSQLNLCFQFFRNSVLKTAVKLFVGYIHNDIRVDHLSALSLSS